jgi:hypothetical protein
LPSVHEQVNRGWRRWIDTFLPSPDDICDWEDAPILSQSRYVVEPRSLVLVVETTP